jgi:hypothetical protein
VSFDHLVGAGKQRGRYVEAEHHAVLTLRAVTNSSRGEDYDISVRGGPRVSGTWLAIQART